MKGDMVIIKSSIADSYRKSHAMSRVELYRFIGIHFVTGTKIFTGEPVHLNTAKKIASAIVVDVCDLIQSWQ